MGAGFDGLAVAVAAAAATVARVVQVGTDVTAATGCDVDDHIAAGRERGAGEGFPHDKAGHAGGDTAVALAEAPQLADAQAAQNNAVNARHFGDAAHYLAGSTARLQAWRRLARCRC